MYSLKGCNQRLYVLGGRHNRRRDDLQPAALSDMESGQRIQQAGFEERRRGDNVCPELSPVRRGLHGATVSRGYRQRCQPCLHVR